MLSIIDIYLKECCIRQIVSTPAVKRLYNSNTAKCVPTFYIEKYSYKHRLYRLILDSNLYDVNAASARNPSKSLQDRNNANLNSACNTVKYPL